MGDEAKENQAQLGVMMSMVVQMIVRRYNLVLSLVMRTPVSTTAIVSPQKFPIKPPHLFSFRFSGLAEMVLVIPL
jgi:hypothetical protein